jgi:hypothetical protein
MKRSKFSEHQIVSIPRLGSPISRDFRLAGYIIPGSLQQCVCLTTSSNLQQRRTREGGESMERIHPNNRILVHRLTMSYGRRRDTLSVSGSVTLRFNRSNKNSSSFSFRFWVSVRARSIASFAFGDPANNSSRAK